METKWPEWCRQIASDAAVFKAGARDSIHPEWASFTVVRGRVILGSSPLRSSEKFDTKGPNITLLEDAQSLPALLL
jgi:hypothetical protein